MEAALKRSADTGEKEATISIEERRTSKSNCEEEDCPNKHMLLKDNQLELAKAEMCEVRQENKRLKLYLDKMMMDYQTLKKKFHTISHEQNQADKIPAVKELGPEDSEFVSLSLGRTMSLPIHDQAKGDHYNEKHSSIPKAEEFRNINLQDKEGFVKLGLDCNFDVPETAESPPNPSLDQNSSEEVPKEDLAGEKKISSPKGNVKTMRSNADDIENSVQQNPTKKARVSVRVRCDTPTMNDGCQWRKYGQKIAKGNPCPRAYYRCTVAPSCPVRKQVQRCSDDMSILITTYEGTHSHPLPISATAMASTTSAAAVMLLSGSSSSSEPGPTPSATAVAAQQLHGLNFYLSKPNPPFYLNSSNTSSPSCPTITLDLANTSSSSSSSSHFNPLSASNNFAPKYYSNNNYSSTNLNFSTTTLESSTSPWNYSAHQSPFNQMGLLNFGSRQPQENLYHSFMQKKNGNYNNVTPTQQSSHSIEAATKAITSDPNFQSALAAALTSIIGTNNNTSPNVKPEQPFPPVTSSSFGLQPLNSQSSNLRFLSPPLPVSSSKTNSSASPGDSNS